MKKTLLLPTMLFPYLIILLFVLFFGMGEAGYGAFQGKFLDNIAVVGIGLLAYIVLAAVLNIVYLMGTRKEDYADRLKAALLVKCVQIPAYVLIFLFGLLLGMMFFMTLPLILLLVITDYITLWLGNMVSIPALLKGMKEKSAKPGWLIAALIAQFFFCTDIISLFVLKKAK